MMKIINTKTISPPRREKVIFGKVEAIALGNHDGVQYVSMIRLLASHAPKGERYLYLASPTSFAAVELTVGDELHIRDAEIYASNSLNGDPSYLGRTLRIRDASVVENLTTGIVYKNK